MATPTITADRAAAIGQTIGIDWGTSPFDVEQFRAGMATELEHGSRDPQTDVTSDDLTLTGMIAWAHLKEFPDYYDRLAAMEVQAQKEWEAKSAHGAAA